ncbi:MAG: sel1 repeat family protein [Thermoguttaceae bacterium]|nr:sel1 repeat family protein [Thermoguttaceae bacterium]
MSTRQFTITAFYLFILVLTSLAALVEVGLADVVTNADLDEPPPVPTFTPSPRSDYEANSRSENPKDRLSFEDLTELFKEARSGSVEAAMKLAKDAENNNIPAAEEKWLKVAAEAGSAEAWYKLGNKAVDKNDDKTAFECFKKSADAGFEDAKIYLAFGYLEGLGTEKDVEKGKALLQSVADSGNATAIQKLAIAYYFGIGFEKNEQKSIELLRQLVTRLSQQKEDYSTLITSLAFLLGMGNQDVMKQVDDLLDNFNLSLILTKDAKINKTVLLMTSYFYHCNQNSDNDKRIAQKRYSSLLDMLMDLSIGSNETFIYAAISMYREDIIDSESQRLKLYLTIEQLSKRDNSAALLALAYLHLKGIGTEKDIRLFDICLDLAARGGDSLAQFYAVLFTKENTELDKIRNSEYIKNAIEYGLPQAYYLYAQCVLTSSEKSPETLELKKNVLAASEKCIKDYLTEKRKRENDPVKTTKDAYGYLCSNNYSKWGHGTTFTPIVAKPSKRQWKGIFVTTYSPEEMSDLLDLDYYVNIGDLAVAVAWHYQMESSGASQDKAKVREHWLKAKECGSEVALDILAVNYWQSDEDEKALEINNEALKRNIPAAFLQRFRFTCYNPDGTDNFGQAFPYLQKAVEMDVYSANRYLGLCYILGKGIKQDVEKGVKILEDNKEYSILTALYETGTGVDRNVEKSKRYYAMSYANTLKIEKIKSGVVSLSTGNCNYDENESISLFRNKYYLRRLEREGVPHSTLALANINSSGFGWGATLNTYQNILDHNLDEENFCSDFSIPLFRKAAQSGDAYDMAGAGKTLYMSANPQDKQDGIELIRKAAKSGQTMAMMFLGALAYDNSVKETDQNRKKELLEEAMDWLKQAADKGNIPACNQLILITWVEFGIDSEKTQFWIDRGIELNSAFAMIFRASVLLLPTDDHEPSQEDRQKGIELLYRAADLGNQDAIAILNDLIRNSQD